MHMRNYYLICIGYKFTATGAHVIEDACGSKEKLSKKLMSGYHGSGLTFDFRSNRIHSKEGFYLGITCIHTYTTRTRTIPTYQIGRINYGFLRYNYGFLRYRRNINKLTTAKKYFVRHPCDYLILHVYLKL